MGKLIFRLTVEGKTPSTWELPQSNVMGIKEGKGKKFMNYYPGEDSCFVEDIFAKNKDLKPGKVPLFKFNAQTGHTELPVDENNVALVNYLKTHPWFGKKFNIFSKDKQAREDLALFDNVEKALELIKESDENKVKATAMAVFGLNHFYKSFTQCAAELKSKAIKEPTVIIKAIEADDYETKYVAGLAFVSGIVTLNSTHTAVVWSDNDGVILHIAQGENGLDKLAEFLRKSSAESEILLQEFQARLDKKTANVSSDLDVTAKLSEKDNLLSEKDRYIKELEEKLSQKSSTKEVTTDTESAVTEEGKEISGKDSSVDDMTLEEAQKAYVEKTGKQLAGPYKTNLEWIKKKLQE